MWRIKEGDYIWMYATEAEALRVFVQICIDWMRGLRQEPTLEKFNKLTMNYEEVTL